MPNLNIIGGLAGPGTTSFTVRGIPRVGTYIDGVWQVGNAGLLTRQSSGPRARRSPARSSGHVIRPRFDGRRDTSRDEDDRRRSSAGRSTQRSAVSIGATLTASFDLPFTDKLRSKWTAASLERDGYIQSLTVDRKYGALDDEVLRGDLLWLPTEKLSFRFNYQSNDSTTDAKRVSNPRCSPSWRRRLVSAPRPARCGSRRASFSSIRSRASRSMRITQQAGLPRWAGRCSGKPDPKSRFPTRSSTNKWRWK